MRSERLRHCYTRFLCAITILVPLATVWAADPLAVVSEVRVGTGEARVQRAGESEWVSAQPLLALRPGDQVRATGNAQLVILFSGGSVQTVSANNSPLAIQAPRGRSGTETIQTLVGGVVQFLMGQQKDPRFEQLAVRGPTMAPRIVSPRETRLLPGPVTFDWTGSAALRYQVKLVGAEGIVWESGNLPRQPLAYPASLPPLGPGKAYNWTLSAPGQSPQQAAFELLSEAESARIQAKLGELRPEVLPGYPPNTVIVMRVGLLLQERLYADARRELLAAVATDPGVPTFRQLLGLVYERTGLEDQAILEYEEAAMLSRPRS